MKHTAIVSRTAVAVGLVCLAVLPGRASTFNWTGGASGDWITGGSWDVNSAPTYFNVYGGNPSAYNVNIMTAGSQVTVTAGYQALAGAGSLTVGSGAQIEVLPYSNGGYTLWVTNSINNAGNIQLDGGTASNLSGTLMTGMSGSSVSLTGGGTITLNAGGQLTNEGNDGTTGISLQGQTIRGTGAIVQNYMNIANGSLIDANGIAGGIETGGTLLVQGGTINNAGIMQASGGGVLQLSGVAVTQNNTGSIGTIQALAGSQVYINGGSSINQGYLTGTETSQLIADNATLQNFTLNGDGTLTLNKALGNDVVIGGTITNQGVIDLVTNPAGGSVVSLSQTPLVLQGYGTFQLNGGTLSGNYATTSQVNLSSSNLIDGSGSVLINGNGVVNFTNAAGGEVMANSLTASGISFSGANFTFTNNGLIEAAGGDTVTIYGLTNYDPSTHTLTGGTYQDAGTMNLRYASGYGYYSADIHTNDAKLVLAGPSYSFGGDGSVSSAIANLSDNASGGTFDLLQASFTTASDFSNEGAIDIASGSTLTVTGTFTENAGATAVIDGSLYSGMLNDIGLMSGSGTVYSPLTVSGTLTVGDDPGVLDVIGNYSQTGTLDIEVGMAEASDLDVTGNVTLGGTLDLTSWGSWSGAPLNQPFTIMQWSGTKSGSFSSIILPDVPGYNFETIWTSNALELEVTQTGATPEPAMFFLVGTALLLGSCRPRRRP